MSRAPARLAAPLAALLLLPLGACARYDPLAELSDAEREAAERLTRDPYVDLSSSHRQDDGSLVLWTRQGNARERYLLVADPEQPDGPVDIRRIERGIVLRGDNTGLTPLGSALRQEAHER